MSRLVYIALFILVAGCNKESVIDAAPSLIGNWKHYSAEDAWHIIKIKENGEGTIEWYTNNKLYRDTKVRDWYVKDNTLYFGKAAFNGELYDITSYPQINGPEVIEGFDTIPMGTRYASFDNATYVEF